MTTATKTPRKAAQLFSVRGDALGIKTTLSASTEAAIEKAAQVFAGLAQASATFPRAAMFARGLADFLAEPTKALPADGKHDPDPFADGAESAR